MPTIFDNIETPLLPALREALNVSYRADFCVGYFNLRGWKALAPSIDSWTGGSDHQKCRLLVGMQRLPHEELRDALNVLNGEGGIDNQIAIRLKRRLADEFREQLALGTPTNEDEDGLRKLQSQIRARKLSIKLHLRYPLHAKLYLLFRADKFTPILGYLGSSNLTFAGLAKQGELNVDILEQDAARKLAAWFEERWADRFCVDISDELLEIIDESWARERLTPPYHIYIKIAYHLSQEARAGLAEFRIPRVFGKKLFKFQSEAVKIAAHHLNKRDGVLIGDVVGLGKTLVASAVLKIFEEQGDAALILCPKNLVKMWNDYRERYELGSKVMSISQAIRDLPELRRYRLVLIDESHNLRNRESKTYRAIEEYIRANDSKCVLLSATPYNKTFLDLSSQLRLFVGDDEDIGIRPERIIREIGEPVFRARYQCPPRSLRAFEKSPHPDDWRDLMRLYLVRRTRSFIQDNYAETDPETRRKFLTFDDGRKATFPTRIPKTVAFRTDARRRDDQYAKLFAPRVVDRVNGLALPRYGLGNYVAASPNSPPSSTEERALKNLSRAGKRLMGFCRTNLFKRLESSGVAFLQSVERHILRNYVFLHAIENGKDLPLGTQDAEYLDSRFNDDDDETRLFDEDAEDGTTSSSVEYSSNWTDEDFRVRAAEVYRQYSGPFRKRFNWLRGDLFVSDLETHLREDSSTLLELLLFSGQWQPSADAKLNALHTLIAQQHPNEKVLIFTQFADTADYLCSELARRGVTALASVTGSAGDPTALAWAFSPESNGKRATIPRTDELRVLIATDILSEGQNLQDAAIVVNFDLPWAIIRLVQRAGRVDRIGQQSDNILCYSFLPTDGVEQIIRLRARVRQRLRENAEVVGTDEAFFEDDAPRQTLLDLYHEKSGILDGEADAEVDLSSLAYQIWKQAVLGDSSLQRIIPALPDVIYGTRSHEPSAGKPEGVLVYMRTKEDNDALAYIDRSGNSITESQLEILKIAECSPTEPSRVRHPLHHSLVHSAAKHIATAETQVGGQLGRPSGARHRVYARLKGYAEEVKGTLFSTPELDRAVDEVFRYPLRPVAVDVLNRLLRSGVSDADLAEAVLRLREEDRLCRIDAQGDDHSRARIICSMGLFSSGS